MRRVDETLLRCANGTPRRSEGLGDWAVEVSRPHGHAGSKIQSVMDQGEKDSEGYG